MINQRLFDQYNINTKKHLGITNRCPRPFDTILIDKNGSCYACECTSWLPQSIGNLQIKTLDEIVCSPMHEHLQQSILDKSFRYCNEHQCTYIRKGDVKNTNTAVTYIEHLRLAIDDSCNLRCPSCRSNLIFYKEGSQYDKRIKLANKINTWLQNLIHPCTVHIGSDGDPFASHVYRYFMEHTPSSDQIKYSLLTNGLLIKEFHNKIPHILEKLIRLGISIDGATKDTYEELRLGGSWLKIQENLEFVSKLKKEHNFEFILYMVVQQDNWHEMAKMVDLGHQYSADRVIFNKIEDWNTLPNFKEKIVPEHLENFQSMLKTVKGDPIATTWEM